MAQITPQEILDISEPIEAIYQRTVDELLINIARHFEISGWERTRYWEIKKLSEMGALTKESAAIIAKNTQMVPAEIEKAFLQVSEKACKDIDPQLREAAEKGILQDPQNTPSTSVLMRQQVQAYVDQAIEKTNLVNTTMLESTRQVYLYGVQTAVNAATRAELKETLEAGALSVVTGAETRTMAIRKAMNNVASMGITGFTDRAGRKWSPDAYVSMVIRTTAHNTAIQSIKTRQMEYGGGDIFQVSSHPGARPLCYPYQGKFFSWSSEGEFTDGAGRKHTYNNIEDSSYGEPAGLFGINCGHHPIPMIPGFSYPQDGPKQDEEQNDKAYEESQVQRQYEREIREAKRELEIAKATGDTEAIKAAEQKLAQKQANMRAFTKETGRPRRYDREAIGGQKIPEGYRGYKQELNSDIPLGKTPREPDPEATKIIDSLKRTSIKYKEVERHDAPMTEEAIIARLAGGDMTKGSCSSLAFAYCGQKNGLDVIDFRGGDSQYFFSRNSNIEKIGKLRGVDATIHEVEREVAGTWDLIKDLPIGKEYYLRTGKHAAIVKNTETGVYYLEMQSRYDSWNGWQPFDNNPIYGTPEMVLRKRFGCRKTADITRFWDGTNTVHKKRVMIADVDSFKGNEDFKEILGYINTDIDKQKKGGAGSVK